MFCSHKYHGRNPASKIFFWYQGCHRIIWMCRQSFLGGSANFITLDTTVMISAEWMKAVKKAEAMGIELPYHSTKSRLENQSDPMYGNNKKKTTSPFPTPYWKKTSWWTMHTLFRSLTSNMPQWKTDIAGLCAGCVWLVKECHHRENWQRDLI